MIKLPKRSIHFWPISDNNTKFFHFQASKRHRGDLIRGIKNESDTWQMQSKTIASVLIKYYQELFATSNLDLHMAFLDHIPMVITDDMYVALTGTFLKSKIVTALKQMAQLKALGPNRMPPYFINIFRG